MVQRDMRMCERIIEETKKEMKSVDNEEQKILNELDAMIDQSNDLNPELELNPFLSKQTCFEVEVVEECQRPPSSYQKMVNMAEKQKQQ